MKVFLLCGGRGFIHPESRQRIPKALSPVGARPVLWHIMKTFATYGHTEFVLALGEGGDDIRQYFLQYSTHGRDVEVNVAQGTVQYLNRIPEDNWRIKLIETGLNAQAGSRLARCRQYLEDETFLLSYSDCLCNVNINQLLAFHRARGKLLTVTGIQPPSRFGTFLIQDEQVIDYNLNARLTGMGGYINGGYMVMEPGLFDHVEPFNECMLEREVFSHLVKIGQVAVYPHHGYWQSVDTERDILILSELDRTNQRPWLAEPDDLK